MRALGFELFGDGLHLSLGCSARCLRFEPADHLQKMTAGRRNLLRTERERSPKLRAIGLKLERGRHHADDYMRLAIKQYRLPDNALIASKAPLPQTVT